jgi:hypothetical protein
MNGLKHLISQTVAAVARPFVARPFSGTTAAAPQVADPPAFEYDPALDTKEICLENCPPDHLFVNEPTVYDSLEWTLTSPPPIHQFEEPPVKSNRKFHSMTKNKSHF